MVDSFYGSVSEVSNWFAGFASKSDAKDLLVVAKIDDAYDNRTIAIGLVE